MKSVPEVVEVVEHDSQAKMDWTREENRERFMMRVWAEKCWKFAIINMLGNQYFKRNQGQR